MRAYHLELLQTSLQMLLCADEGSNTRDVLDLVKLIVDDVSTDAPRHSDNAFLDDLHPGGDGAGCRDPVLQWWALAVRAAAAWLRADGAAAPAGALAARLAALPDALADDDDPLPGALHLAYKSRRGLLSLAHCEEAAARRRAADILLKVCDAAGARLADSLAYYCCRKPTQLMMLMQVLCCDWLLEVRAGVWEGVPGRMGERSPGARSPAPGRTPPAPHAQLRAFQRDLHSLRRLSQTLPWVWSRVFVQAAVARMMAGAAPRRTLQLLDGSRRHRLHRGSLICGKERAVEGGGGEGERAVALYMACRHLPAAVLAGPGERAGMLAQAAATLHRIGHRSRLPHCYHLMKTLGTLPAP